MEELEELKISIIKILLKGDNLDEPYLLIRGNPVRKYTRRELAKAIENDTPDGRDTVRGIVNLATNLILREKETMK